MKIYHDVAGSQVEAKSRLLKAILICLMCKRSFLDAIKEDGPSPVPSGQIIYNQAIMIIAKSALGRG